MTCSHEASPVRYSTSTTLRTAVGHQFPNSSIQSVTTCTVERVIRSVLSHMLNISRTYATASHCVGLNKHPEESQHEASQSYRLCGRRHWANRLAAATSIKPLVLSTVARLSEPVIPVCHRCSVGAVSKEVLAGTEVQGSGGRGRL